MSSHTQATRLPCDARSSSRRRSSVAFEVFTEEFDLVKPRDHNLLGVEIAETVFERRSADTSTTEALTAASAAGLGCSPTSRPERVVISWDISPRWQIETDLENTSEVEVRFIAETQVTAPGSSSSIATWTATATNGGRCATASAATVAGRCTCSVSRT